MSEELRLCPFCEGDLNIDEAIANANHRPIEDAQAARITELEKENREQLIDYENRLCEARRYQQDAVKRCEELEQIAEVQKSAKRLLEQERNELEADRDRLRKALERVVKLLDRPMLKDDMCLYMGTAIKVAREAMAGGLK